MTIISRNTEPLTEDPEIVGELLNELDDLLLTWIRYIRDHPAEHGPLDPDARYLAGLKLCADQLDEILSRRRSHAEHE